MASISALSSIDLPNGKRFRNGFSEKYLGLDVEVKVLNTLKLKVECKDACNVSDSRIAGLNSLRHPSLLRFFGLSEENGNSSVVMESCPSTLFDLLQHFGFEYYPSYDMLSDPLSHVDLTVRTYIQVRETMVRTPPMGWHSVWRIAVDLAHGLAYLHSEGMLHLNVKSSNVFFDSQGHVKLSAWGAHQLQRDESTPAAAGCKDSVDAASQDSQDNFTTKSDIFNYGLVLLEMVKGENLLDRGAVDPLDTTIPDTCELCFRELIENCLQSDAFHRPSAAEVIKHLEKFAPSLGLTIADILVPRLEDELEIHQVTLLQYIPSRVEGRQETILTLLNNFLEDEAPRVLVVLGEGGLGKSLCTYFLADKLLKERRKHNMSRCIVAPLLTQNFLIPRIATIIRTAFTLGVRCLRACLAVLRPRLSTLRLNRTRFLMCVLYLRKKWRAWRHYGPWIPIFVRPGMDHWRHDALKDGLRKVLLSLGCNLHESAIELLRKERLLFIFDGYDELSGHALGNLPHILGLQEWPNAKLLITSRPAAVHPEQIPLLFGLNGKCHAYTLLPFNAQQRLEFIRKTLAWNEDKRQQFAEELSRVPVLENYLQNPFVLQLFVQSLESQKEGGVLIPLKLHTIYDNFVSHWVTQTVECTPPSIRSVVCSAAEATREWLTRTAFAMAKQQTFSLQTDVIASSNPWTAVQEHVKDQTSPEMDKQLLLARLQSCLDKAPLRERSRHYQFLHKSMWNYALACGIRDTLAVPQDLFPKALESGFTPEFILQDESTLCFLNSMASAKDLHAWKAWVHASAQRAELAPIAACAITALNGLNVVPEDLRGVRVPGADLRNAMLNNSDCTAADFSSALLMGSSLDGAKLQLTNFADTRLGRPSLEFDHGLHNKSFNVAAHPTENLLAVSALNRITIIDPLTQVISISWELKHVKCITFHPSGTALVTGGMEVSEDSENSVWDSLNGTSKKVEDGEGCLQVWDPHSGTCIATLRGHSRYVKTVAYSPDGMIFASGSKDGMIRLWHTHTLTELGTLHSENPLCAPTPVNVLAWSTDNLTLISGHSKLDKTHTLRLWDVASGSLRSTVNNYTEKIRAVACSPCGSTVAVSEDSEGPKIRLWNSNLGIALATLEGHTNQVNALVYSRDGAVLASASSDHTVRLWDSFTFTLLATLSGHVHSPRALAFTGNRSNLVSLDSHSSIYVWDIIQSSEDRAMISATNPHSDIRLLSHSGDSTVLVSQSFIEGTGGVAQLWNRDTWRYTLGWSAKCDRHALSPDGLLLALGIDTKRVIRIVDTSTMSEISTFKVPRALIECIAFSPNSVVLAAGGCDNIARLWKVYSGTVTVLKGHTSWVTCLAFSSNGEVLATGSHHKVDKTLRLWDTQTGLPSQVLPVEGGTNSLAFHPDGTTLVSAHFLSENVRVWNLRSNSLRCYLADTKAVSLVAYSPEGVLATANGEGLHECSVRLWDTGVVSNTHTLRFPTYVQSLSFGRGQLGVGLAHGGGFQLYDITCPIPQRCWSSGPSLTLSTKGCNMADCVGLTETQCKVLAQHAKQPTTDFF